MWPSLPSLVLAGAVVWLAACQGAPPPPTIAQLEDFRLVDQRGDEFGSAELRGRVWVANFFFTTCPSICPRLMDVVQGVRSDLDAQGFGEVLVVSISIDPERDTPAQLEAYGEGREIDPASWRLLTGPRDEIEGVAGQFMLAIGEKVERGAGVYDIAHSAKLVLVDGEGGIRGYYSSEDDGPRQLLDATQRLLSSS